MPYIPRVLVIESEASLAQVLEAALKVAGADPRCVSNEKEAASLIDSEKFDGAFLDWSNTGVGGAELTQRIRSSKSNSKIPIAMLAAGADRNAVKTGFALGVNFYLSKPFSARQIQHLLNVSRGSMLVERRRYQRVPLNLPAVCEWEQSGQPQRIAGKTVNVSSSGLLMMLYPQPQVGVGTMLELLVPALKKTFKPSALVKRAGPGQLMAFEFLIFPAEDKDLLLEFLGRNLLESNDPSLNPKKRSAAFFEVGACNIHPRIFETRSAAPQVQSPRSKKNRG